MTLKDLLENPGFDVNTDVEIYDEKELMDNDTDWEDWTPVYGNYPAPNSVGRWKYDLEDIDESEIEYITTHGSMETIVIEVRLKVGIPFVDDVVKMDDFFHLTREDFLASYGYLTDLDYDATIREVKAQPGIPQGQKITEGIELLRIMRTGK